MFGCGWLLFSHNAHAVYAGDPAVDPTQEIQLNVLAVRAARERESQAAQLRAAKATRLAEQRNAQARAQARAREAAQQLNATADLQQVEEGAPSEEGHHQG